MSVKATQPNTISFSRPGYYPILDALRFVLAFWVAVGHYKVIPLFGDANTGTGLWHLFKRGWNTTVFGTPAVIVFFVISGFCIHLPFRGTEKIDIVRYYLRRYTRILIPVAGALAVYRLNGMQMTFWGEHSILWESPLWSLACEEIYYAMYPALRWIRNRIGWKILLGGSFALSVPIAATHPHAENWHVFGPLGTAMLLLPVWLMGCLLAEQSDSLVEVNSRVSIWGWRFLAWLGCWTSEMMHFKLGISYTQTMLWFGVLAFFWLRSEIAHGKNHAPNRHLVAAGAWSYSLYLVHAQGGGFFERLHLPSLGGVPDWIMVMASSLLFSYLFYLLIERPSHKLARKIRVRGARNVSDFKKVAVDASPELNPSAEKVVGL
jgi:peptidoglycan/LPS O-acetylase OafA/YrhL